MMGGAWRVAMLGLAVAAAALAYLGVELVRLAGEGTAAGVSSAGFSGAYGQGIAVAGVGLLALWVIFGTLSRHFRDLGRLRDRFTGGGDRLGSDRLGGGWTPKPGSEAGLLAQAAAGLSRSGPLSDRLLSDRSGAGRLERSLSALLSLSEQPVLLLDDRGRIERLNAAATRLLDAREGDDIGGPLVREDLLRAVERARGDGDAVSAVLRRADGGELSARIVDLGLQAGVALAFPVRNAGGPAGLSGTRTLSLRPAAVAGPPGDDEPLAALPFVALWVATAGREPDAGPVVAVGTVRLAGARVFRTVSLSVLIDPAAPIAAEAAARHGVATETVAGARPFAEAWPAIADSLHHCVAVGVGVEAALAALARACAQAGLPDPVLPAALDLGALAVALNPALAGATLDGLASAFGLAPAEGLFGPAMRQAELAAALLLRLDQRGVATHGQARALLAQSGG